MSASNSDSSIKAKELGTKHYQRMNDEEGDLYYGLRSAMRSPGPNQGRFALVQMAMILEIRVSEQRFKDFLQVHLGMLPTMLKECEKTKSFKPFISLFGEDDTLSNHRQAALIKYTRSERKVLGGSRCRKIYH